MAQIHSVTKTQYFDGFQIDTYSDGTYGYMTDGGKHKEGYKSKDGAKKAATKLTAKAAKAQENTQAKLLEKQAQELQEKLQLTYANALDGMTARIEESLEQFAKDDAKWQADVAAGKKDAKAYKAWRKDQALHDDQLKALKKALTQDLTAVDKMAIAYVNQVPAGVYAEGMNFATYEIEHGAKADTSFTLYNKNTVMELVANEPDLLPHAAFDKAKDTAWNSRHVTSAVTQAVLQGQTVPQLAASIAGIAAMDQRAAMKAARTAMTSAHSLGKLKGYERAAGMGIDVEKQWLAALDSRTRGSHRHLDGETVKLDAEFSNGLKYPGDPDGPASEVYNCRCTLVPVIGDVEYDEVERANKLGDMTYEEWKAAKSENRVGNTVSDFIGGRELSNDEIKSIVERFDSSAVLDYGFKDNEGDLIGKALAEATGAAGKPKLVSSIDELDDTMIVTYRGFSDVAFADQFTTGEYWCGQGIYGCGSYTAIDKDTALQYADGNNDAVVAVGIPSSAKIITRSDLRGLARGDDTLTGDIREIMRDDIGRWGVAHGYDAIRVPLKNGDYYVVLNRSIVTVVRNI